jgi:hypothetical protein
MFSKEYMDKYQKIVNYWKDRFDVLYDWQITYTFNDYKWCQIDVDKKRKQANIYVCDIQEPNDFILNKIITIAFIASDTTEMKQELIKDLVSAITEDK